jgi:hypothetical protein
VVAAVAEVLAVGAGGARPSGVDDAVTYSVNEGHDGRRRQAAKAAASMT